MSPVEHRHLGIGLAAIVHGPHLGRHPVRLQLAGLGVEIEGLSGIGADGSQFLFQPLPVLVDEGVGRRQDLGHGTVVGVQVDGLHIFVAGVEFQNEFHIRAAPGVDGLVRVAHHEEIFVIPGEDICQGILVLVDVLKLVHHDVFEPCLPLLPGVPVMLQNVESEVNEIVKIQTVALALFIKIAVHDLVLQGSRLVGQVHQPVQIGINEGLDVSPAALAPADVVHRLLDGHIPGGDAQILEDSAEHGLLVLLVQDDEGGGIADDVAVLFQKAHAEAVEGGDAAQILVGQNLSDSLFHLRGGLVGKGDAEDIGGGNAQLFHEVHVPGRQGLGLAGARTRHHTDEALRGGSRLILFGIQFR